MNPKSSDVLAALEKTPDDKFHPNLRLLESLMQSLQIKQ
jgi:hypothetical protein